MLYYETVTADMVRISKVIFEAFDSEFYLAGGTSLALQIGHRMSIDLDYFIQKDFDTQSLKQQLFDAFPESVIEIVHEERNTLWCSIDDVKVSFITRKDTLHTPVTITDCFRLASIHDITLMKLSAICNRDEFKDYFDLACISKITDVRSWMTWWEDVYPNTDITSWLIALGSVETIPEIDLDSKDDFKALHVQRQIQTTVREITSFLQH